MARGFFDCPFLKLQLFVHTVLEVDIRIVDAPEEIRAEHTFEQATGQIEAVGKEALGPYANKLSH
jgi:hypothetical protein